MPDDRFGAPRRPRAHGSNGTHPEALQTPRSRFDEISGEPVDLVAVQADDELINALASGMAVSAPGFGGYDADDQVAALLASWKAEVDAEPVPQLVDLRTAVTRVRSAARPPGRRLRLVGPLAAAAAVVVLSAGGLTYNAAAGARPGDGLAWDIARVVDAERTESVLAAERVEERIAVAKNAIARGEPEVAREALAAAAADLPNVRVEENGANLAELQDFLAAKTEETEPGVATNPGTPLASNPARRVPPGAAPGQQPVAPAPAPEPATTPVPERAPNSPAGPTGPDPEPGPGTPAEDAGPTTAPDEVAPTTTPEPTPTPEGDPDGPEGPAPEATTFDSSDSGDGPPAASGDDASAPAT